jgi:predicted transcriptional regulator of viral defense system
MKTYSLIEQLARHNMKIFRLEDAAKITRKPTAYTSKLLSNNDHVQRIERGVYCITGRERPDVYEIASSIVYPSYVSMFSAFQYYGLTEQGIVKHSVVTIKRHKKLSFEDYTIKFFAIHTSRFFGYKREGSVFIATPEKAIIDALYFNEPYYSYVQDVIDNAIKRKIIDIRKLKDYAVKMRVKSLFNKLGFLLEKNGISSEDLLKFRNKNIVKLSRNFSKIDKKWMVAYD